MRSVLGLWFSSLSFPRSFHRCHFPSKIRTMNSSATPSGVTGTIDLRPVDSLSPAADLSGKVHLLPCCIRQDGPCPVSDYFRPQSTGLEVDGLKVQEAFFRGRRLQGTTVPVPDGYRGYLLCKRDPVNIKDLKGSEGEPNDWVAHAEFQNITYWNHDDIPSKDDPVLRCFHWFTIADAVHFLLARIMKLYAGCNSRQYTTTILSTQKDRQSPQLREVLR